MHAATDSGQVYTTDYTVDFARVEMRDAASCRVDYTVDVNGEYTEDCGTDVQLSWPWSRPITKIILDELQKPEHKIKKCLNTLEEIDNKDLFRELYILGEEVKLRQSFTTTINSDKKVLIQDVKDKAGADDKAKAGADDKVSNKASNEQLDAKNGKLQQNLKSISSLVKTLWNKLETAGIQFPVLVRTFEHVGGKYDIKYYRIGDAQSVNMVRSKDEVTVLQPRYYHAHNTSTQRFEPKEAMILLRDAEFLINGYVYLHGEMKKIREAIKEFKKKSGVK